jgi:protein-histidine N-methyltransferase
LGFVFPPFSTLPLSLAPSCSLSPSLAPSLSPSSPLLQLRHQPIVTIPGDLAVTAVDAAEHPSVGGIVKASGVGDVVALALWLLAERGESASAGGGGAAPPPPPPGSTRKDWGPLLASLPATSDSPVLWPETERKELLRGSPVLSEARERDAALDRQWAELEKVAAESGGGGNGWPSGGDFTRDGFRGAVAAVLANATYLPAAGCFALLPLISVAGRTGRIAGGEGGGGAGGGGGASESGRGGSPGASSSGASSSSRDHSSTKTGALLDYDESLGAAVLSATRPYAPGEQVLLGDGRPSGELLLATGELYADDDPLAVARATNLSTFTTNPSECLTVTVGLVPTDRLLVAKRQILEAAGFPPGSDASQAFPIFPDRMPLQLLAYLRLARLQESAQLASVTFENDVIISQLNEYEVLQLLSGECKERLGNYGSAAEDDLKTLQRPDSSPREKVAARLRLAEKSVLQGTLDAVRRRLAPIRGVPTKDGSMTDANADLLEIFGALEALPSVPGKIVGGFMSWARGDNDPEFQKSRNRRK